MSLIRSEDCIQLYIEIGRMRVAMLEAGFFRASCERSPAYTEEHKGYKAKLEAAEAEADRTWRIIEKTLLPEPL